MTMIYPTTVTCGHCGAENYGSTIASTSEFGSMDLDMRPPPLSRDTLEASIQECSNCGYCAPDIETWIGKEGALASREYKDILADKDFPETARRFMAYGALAESSGQLLEAAWAQRSAAWDCDDHGRKHVQSSRRCRKEVLRLLKLLHLNGRYFTEDRITDAILELDLLRRSRQFHEVRTCADTLANVELPEVHQAILAFQLRLAAAGDSACHQVSDAFEHVE